MSEAKLFDEAIKLFKRLKKKNKKIVFAESCTGGLVSATLARIPGVSNYLCGSTVVYRENTKSTWLGIPKSYIDKHGVVSAEVAYAMSKKVLQKTPEASCSVSITGYLGPDAPSGHDGQVFIAALCWGHNRRQIKTIVKEKFILPQGGMETGKENAKKIKSLREKRQILASLEVLFVVRSLL